MPRVKVSTQVKSFRFYRLLFVAKRNVTSYPTDSTGMDVQERGNVLQIDQLNDTRTALQQHFVTLTGCGTVEGNNERMVLADKMIGHDSTQFHCFHALVEKLLQLLTRNP